MSGSDAVNIAAVGAANALRLLDPGPLAELRRMEAETAAPAFWRLAARYPDSIGARPAEWLEIIRILAILTPKGLAEGRPALHDANRALGAALCDGGDPGWSGDRPALSERRLAQLLAARGPARVVALTRAARALARSRPPQAGLDVRGIAWAILHPTGTARIAEQYYRRLDRSTAAAVAEAAEKDVSA
jgi:CRISPR system Cascade subunit CasB